MRIPSQHTGPALEADGPVAVLIHGRSQSSRDMLDVAKRLDLPQMPIVAVDAADNSWYPYPFMEPVAHNEPSLGYSLERLDRLISELNASGIPNDRIAIVGFSQGACLACEYVFRKHQPFAALVAYTGGLIGPDGMQWQPAGCLEGMRVFLSNGDQDPWVPVERTKETLNVFKALGADTEFRVYPGRSHEICDDEIMASRALLQRALHLTTEHENPR